VRSSRAAVVGRRTVTAVGLDDPLRDREPQPGAGDRLLGGASGAEEPLEEVADVLLRERLSATHRAAFSAG
jgi:hypothetical protein